MLKVVIIGYGTMFTNLIAGTLDANCRIVGVFRHEMVKYHPFIRKIKDILNPSLEHNYIRSYNLPEIEARGVNTDKFKKALLKLNPDIILVGSWGEKIKKEIFDLPKIASINAHPSLLPKYRGPNPYFWTIRNGEDASGITFHLIDHMNINIGPDMINKRICFFELYVSIIKRCFIFFTNDTQCLVQTFIIKLHKLMIFYHLFIYDIIIAILTDFC